MTPQPPNIEPGPQRRGEPPPAGAAHPALLLPVRIETRFGGTPEQPELWVRVYPDQVAIDTHDPRFTDAEVASARRYWEALWRAGTADRDLERRAWQALAQRHGATRAAYLIHAEELAPANLAQRPAGATAAGQDPVPPAAFAPLGADQRRDDAWARAPRALGMPDHWTVALERDGAVVRRATGAAIAGDLAFGPTPGAAAQPTPDGLAIDAPMRWMVDFEEAVRVGMGLRIGIDSEDRAAGFDRVLVYGLSPTQQDRSGPDRMRSLLEAHRFTDGFALVPQGAATNNTVDGPAAQTRADPGFARSFALEGGAPGVPIDGAVLAEALGLPPEALARAEHCERTDQLDARTMAVALWPATGGYFLEQMVPELVDRAGREQARAYVLERVRARGPLPAIRVGETPYGILPTTALSLLRSKRLSPVGRRVAELARRLWPDWRRGVARAPHVTRGGDPDAELVAVLGMDASARAYRARHAFGEQFARHSLAWLGVGRERPDLLSEPGAAQLARLGYDGDPRLVHLGLSSIDRLVTLPLVEEAAVSEEHGLSAVALPQGGTGNYISWLRQAPLGSIRDDEASFPGGPPRALLYKVLRQALLTEYAHSAKRILVEAELADPVILRETELVGFEHLAAPVRAQRAEGAAAAALPRPTAWEALAHPMPGQRDRSIADHLLTAVTQGLPEAQHLGELLEALDRLAGLSTAALERLFTETMDLFSHRLDAWITSLAVDVDRARTGEGERDFHIGGYGWVEDLRAKPLPPPVRGNALEHVRELDAERARRAPKAPPPPPVRGPREDEAGFVHAPSLAQARAGAVLRSGYLTHRDTSDGQLLAIDLSSRRVRTALEVLDGIRKGQSLGALLGYRFERGLNAAGLQVLVQPYRDRFPVVANRVTEPSQASEAVAASSVVDGRALHVAWREGDLWSGPPAVSAGQRVEVERLLADLDDVLDAIGDVSIAESVHQIMAGNPVHAGGLIDAISRGERPSEPDVVRTPRAGIDVTHRLAVLLTPGPARAGGWPGAAHPRALAEPRLDAWVSAQIAHPERVRCRVSCDDAGVERRIPVTLADLGLAPLDALELAQADDEPQESELEQRVLYHAQRAAPAGSDSFEIVFERESSWDAADRSFPEFLATARPLREMLGASRPLLPQDLIEPERRAAEHGAVLDTAELAARAATLLANLQTTLDGLRDALTASDLRQAIRSAGLYGVLGPVPVVAVSDDAAAIAALRAQADKLRDELDRRLQEAQEADAAFDRAAAAPEALTTHLTGLVQTVLGEKFVVCPQFVPAAGAELHTAFGDTGTLLDGEDDAPHRWIAQASHVRGRVAHFARCREAAWLFQRRRPPVPSIAQLPAAPGDRWLALDFDPAKPPPASGRVSIVAQIEPSHATAEPHAGLLVDEWVERIPATEQSTGVAFHYDQPSARAPQSLLFAVCPDDRERWDDEALGAVVGETLDLAQARTVDLESLDGLGQLLPALYFPFNVEEETVSLPFLDLLPFLRGVR